MDVSLSLFFCWVYFTQSAIATYRNISIIGFTGPKTKPLSKSKPLPNLGHVILFHNKLKAPLVQKELVFRTDHAIRNRLTARTVKDEKA